MDNKKIPCIKIHEAKPYDLLDNEQLKYKRANISGSHDKLYVADIQSLIGKFLCDQDYRLWPRFCKFSRSQYLSTIHCVVVEGYSKTSLINDSVYDNYNECKNRLPEVQNILSTEIKFVDSMSYGIHWRTEFFEIPGEFMTDTIRLCSDLSLNFKDFKERIGGNSKRKLADMKRSSNHNLEILKASLDIRDPKSNLHFNANYDDEIDAFPRTKLLLTRDQMIAECLPVDGEKDLADFIHLRSIGDVVIKDTSPLFAIDCEMVNCISSLASKYVKTLAAITIVNERRQIVYKSYVKPTEYVVDYLTRYSGVSAKILEGVETTLADVQTAMKELLPLDAILVGHSIGNDLEALKIYYPYVIDTSTIFSLKSKFKKDKLKQLTSFFLNRTIQNGGMKGHDSEEDAIATMDLVKLKLGKSIDFGIYTKASVKIDGAGLENGTNNTTAELQPSTQSEENCDYYPVATANPLYLRHRENLEAIIDSFGSIHLVDYYLNCLDCPVAMQELVSDIDELRGSRASKEFKSIWREDWFKESHRKFLEEQEQSKDSNNRRHKPLHPFNFTVINNCQLERNTVPSQRWLNKLYKKLLKEWNMLPANSLMLLFTVNCRPGMEATGYVNYGIKLVSD